VTPVAIAGGDRSPGDQRRPHRGAGGREQKGRTLMNDWKKLGAQIERPEWNGNPADQRKALGKEETRERIAFIEELLPNLSGDDLSLAHGTLAVLYGLLAGGSDAEPNHQSMVEHARAATELNCDLATPWRIMVEVHFSVDRTEIRPADNVYRRV